MVQQGHTEHVCKREEYILCKRHEHLDLCAVKRAHPGIASQLLTVVSEFYRFLELNRPVIGQATASAVSPVLGP